MSLVPSSVEPSSLGAAVVASLAGEAKGPSCEAVARSCEVQALRVSAAGGPEQMLVGQPEEGVLVPAALVLLGPPRCHAPPRQSQDEPAA